MKPQDVALWLGLASTVGGAAIGYGTLTEKVASLEKDNAPTQLEGRLVKLETRVEDNDVGKIGKEIEQLRGEVKRLDDKLSGLRIPETGELEKKVSVLETKVDDVKGRLKDVGKQLKELGENPLL
jgi:chromosome segregation ATPase